MTETHIITDHQYAPLFKSWLEEKLGVEFGEEARYIANVSFAGDEVEVLWCTALDTWSEFACELHTASDGTKRQKMGGQYMWAVYNYAFNYAARNCIISHVSPDNEKSLALHDIAGFSKVGLIPGFYGVNQDAYIFSITKQQWLDGKWGSIDPQGAH